MAVTLTTLLPPTRSGRTFFVASSLLGLFAALQMGMLGWHLLHRRTPPSRQGELALLHFSETTEPTTSALDAPFHRNPVASVPDTGASVYPGPTPATAAMQAAAPTIERPTPASANSAYPAADLLEQARILRQNGDANGALNKLRLALISDPSNPNVIAELGITYESMQMPDQAFEQWRRLYNMGDAIGALYYLADTKLHSAQAAPGAGLTGPSARQPEAVAGANMDASGFPENAQLKMTDIHVETVDDPSVEKKVSLKIVVKNRPGTIIDRKKVRIETYFYDLVDGKDVVQTDAQTSFAWLTQPVDWANDESEVLETTYLRPKVMAAIPAPTATPEATPAQRAGRRGRHGRGRAEAEATPAPASPAATAVATPAPEPVRIYLGYIVRLYYDRQLQEVQADPIRLLQRFPPPLTLSEEQ